MTVNGAYEVSARLVRRALPGKTLGERPSRPPKVGDEIGRFGQALQCAGHRHGVTVRHEKARMSITHCFANTG